ncbi:hypothetical protein CDO52_24725 [Nocardiopsis gilva YIM 90087]|uniref:Uncharacterized protein n=1 Tax=Nocardiopsis gilva YIM 90087 TaxID=1235441 RepID=A0A223SBN1_9ACTN|nr:hypothetical protein [Nocardiopsis gilva]ASU85578.1 hypothetical protein CDO52_24725 [Nocardiopsis gilva YIM 90087]
MTDDLPRIDQMTTMELRDRAVALAKRRWDVRFFWHLLESLPAAEAAAGHMDASDASVAQASGLFHEALAAEADTEVQEALRPLYVDYLARHATDIAKPEAEPNDIADT